jgi:hypothetical protein
MRRALAVSLATGIALLTAVTGTLPATARTANAATPSQTTVSGPHMYIPGTANSFYKQASTVTVSQTASLVNQLVHVSWTGFTPSSAVLYDPTSTDYPVMVAECRGTHPTDPSQCYDATNGGQTASLGSGGPGNTQYGTTTASGTGGLDIEIYTGLENQFLGCDQNHPCSLVIVPSQGGDSLNFNPPHCADHTQDTQTTDLGQYAFNGITSSPGSPNGYCSWQKRIAVPLNFAPSPGGCPLRNADFSAVGSPMLARAMNQWETGLCAGSSSIQVQYNSEINEMQARNNFAAGIDDVAFTTRPLTGTAKHPYTYAPVAVSATSVAYWVDNTTTGQPFRNLKLDARLLVKLLTTSYAFTGDGCPQAASQPFGCDNSVDGSPPNLFADPEFNKLNPGVSAVAANPDGFQVPTVVSGDSDMTYVTTRWAGANKDAASFLAGQFDPWGMHVNTSYLGLKYPVDAFAPQDSYFPLAQRYSPTFPLSTVAQYQAQNWEPGTSDQKNPVGNYENLPILAPGQRDLFAILDQADAADFRFPVAAIRNAAGQYVTPTAASMAAAVKDMTVNPDGITRDINQTSQDPNAYPLTMVIYAVVPTGGISHAKAQKIASFLDFVARQGQNTGTSPGNLAPGYLPLPQALRAQTLKAASEVLNQTGNVVSRATTPAASPATSHSALPSASRPTSASASASPRRSSPPTAHGVAVSYSHPVSTGMTWIVLALIIAGGVLLTAGPTALILGSPAARAAVARTARRTGWLRRPRLIRPTRRRNL